MNTIIGNRIKQLRKKQGLSQEKLARKISLDRTYLSRVEAGKQNITILLLEIICKGLDISFKDFFDFDM